MMKNRIKKRDSYFVQVANSFLRDEHISFKAKGLFCYMFSMDDNWNFTIRSMAKQQKDGEASIKSALDELKEYGYVSYIKHQDGSGTYYLDDEPNVENPNVENPKMGKPPRIKNKQSSKNKNITSYDDFMLLWNEFATKHNKTKVLKLTDKRKKSIATRDKDFTNFKELFRLSLDKASKSSFLRDNKFFDFDWLIVNDTNIVKVYEGKYDGEQQHTRVAQHYDTKGNPIYGNFQ